MASITPDLSVNINNTLYLTAIHNYQPALYLLGFLVAIYFSIKKPSRCYTFMLLGFICLLFQFEYTKHIIDGLKEQTTNSFITTTPHYTAKRWLNAMIEDLAPMFMFIAGWFFLVLSFFSRSQPNSPSAPAHK